jgi:hypothetical protein
MKNTTDAASPLDIPVRGQAATVWFAPTARRRFLTKRAAIAAEARALIEARHPRERQESDERGITYPGWSWRELPRSDVLYRRVSRMVLMRSNAVADSRPE